MTKLVDSYSPADRSVPLRDLTVGDALRNAAADSPDMVGLVAGIPGVDRRWTFAEMLAEAERVAGALGPLLSRRADRGVGAQPARVGVARVRRRPRGCRAGHGQPRVPASRAGVRARSVGQLPASCWWTSGAATRCEPRSTRYEPTSTLREVVLFDGVGGIPGLGRSTGAARGRPRRSRTDPVHVGHDRLPEGRVAPPRRTDRQRRALRAGRQRSARAMSMSTRCRCSTPRGCVLGALGIDPVARGACPGDRVRPGLRARARSNANGAP